jgi:putative NADH-flavin reductase
MNIIVFGASGGTGSKIVEQALEAGHTVTAFVRTPSRITLKHPHLSLFQGDVLDATAVEKAITGQDAIISALAPTRPPVPGMMGMATHHIITAMQQHGIRRLIVTSGAGVRVPLDQPKISDHILRAILERVAGDVLRESAIGVEIILASDLDWTIARYPSLTDGAFTGHYRVGYIGKDSGMRISRSDAADFVVKELTQKAYIRQAPVVSY